MEVFSKRRGKSTRQGSKVGHDSGIFPSLIPSFPPSLPPSLPAAAVRGLSPPGGVTVLPPWPPQPLCAY